MISARMVTTVTFLYLFCTVLYLNYLVFRSQRLGQFVSLMAWGTLLLHTAAILWRWVESYQMGIGHVPLSNMYESLVFFSWCIVLLYLLWERKLMSWQNSPATDNCKQLHDISIL